RRGRVQSRPWQPARPDLGVRRVAADRPGEPGRSHDAVRTPRPHPPADGLGRARRACRADRAGRGLDVHLRSPPRPHRPRQRRPAAGRHRHGELPRRRHRGRQLHVAPDPVRHPGRPGGDDRRGPAAAARPAPGVRGLTATPMGSQQPLSGRKLGDRRVRIERPHAAYFRWTGPGQLTAKEAASAPVTAAGRLQARIKSFFIGRPLASEEEIGERLSKKKALAIFSSDAISSSAYATEEILRVLILGGVAALAFGLQVSIAIAVLLIAVAISYRQICIAYPTGGGSYSVSKRNFGRRASLIAASALMIDYVMTVAVSTSSAVEQVTSAFPALIDERVALGVLAIALITVGNLRGLREAGNLFAIPTYLFVGSALLMIAIGSVRIVAFGERGVYGETALITQTGEAFQTLSLLLLLRAF